MNILLLLSIVLLLGVSSAVIIYSLRKATSAPSPIPALGTGIPRGSPSIFEARTYPPRGAKLVLDDPLLDNSRGYNWDTSNPNNCDFPGDGYHVSTVLNNYTFFCTAFATDFANFVYEAQMTLLEGDSGGLIVRANADRSTFYYFRINQTGYYMLIVYTGHGPGSLVNDGTIPNFHTGLHQPNLIAVVANQDHIELFANHKYVMRVTEGTYNHGQIGVAASTGDGGRVEVVFNNAKVWRL